jgi:hypothetical protein
MSDIPFLGGMLGGGDASDPIVTRLPDTQAAFQTKYQTIAPALGQLPEHIRNALVQFDTDRVNKGQQPLSIPQTASVVKSALTGQAQTLGREKKPGNFLSNVVSDIGQIASSVPRLPVALYREVQELPTLPSVVSGAVSSSKSPGEMLSRIANAPGIRFIPGTYVAGNLARGGEGVNELATHPVMSFLDVLPIAGKVAKGTKVGKAGAAAGRRPLPALLTQTLDDAGELTPNIVGKGVEAIKRTAPGQLATEAFGAQTRSMVQLYNQYKGRAMEDAHLGSTELGQLAQRSRTLHTKYTETLGSERIAALTELIQHDPAKIPDLGDIERTFIAEARELTDDLARHSIDSQDLVDFRGEVYPVEVGRRLVSTESRFNSRAQRITNDILPKLKAIEAPSEKVTQLIADIEAGDWKAALDTYQRRITRSKTRLGAPSQVGAKVAPAADLSLAAVANIRKSLRDVVASEKRLGRLVESNPPARYAPLIEQEARTRLGANIMARFPNDPETVAKITEAITSRNYAGLPGFDINELRALQKEVQATWQDLKAQGLEPVYVHHVSPDRVGQIDNPRVSPTPVKPSQFRERSLDFSPHVNDITVAISHQAMELLSQRASQSFSTDLLTKFGKDEASLLQEYMGAAKVHSSRNPAIDQLTHAERLMRREWTPFDPASVLSPYAVKGLGIKGERVWLPKTVANTLKRMQAPNAPRVTALLDPIMGAFRTSILPLSPRWHVYNILGGGVVTAARTNPITIWKYLGEARKILKGDLTQLPEGIRFGLGGISRDLIDFQYRSMGTLRRLFDEAQDKSPLLRGASDAASTIIKKSFDLNAFFDDMYRVMSYKYGYDKALTKGLSKEMAQRAGVELSRKILQQWDELTPIERTILRNVFPFYGFMQHILRYTLSYPFDHPIRASMMAQFARNELEDMNTGLPQTFLNSFFLGAPDKNGNVKSINLRGLNPFTDVANYFTLAGFLGATNPLISTTLQQAGIDTQTGGPELYPTLRYDARTGRLVADTGNPLLRLVENTIPQARILTALTGASSEFKALMQTNPAAAKRMLASQAGLPVMVRDHNVPQEQFKAELRRQDAQDSARNEALKTGDYDYAKEFPGLRPLLAQIEQLQGSGALAPYDPNTQPSQQSVGTRLSPPTI